MPPLWKWLVDLWPLFLKNEWNSDMNTNSHFAILESLAGCLASHKQLQGNFPHRECSRSTWLKARHESGPMSQDIVSNLIVFVLGACVPRHMCGGQKTTILLLPGSWAANLGHEAWQQVPLPTSHFPGPTLSLNHQSFTLTYIGTLFFCHCVLIF